nr:MAG TPA: hypothetical protein [Caudoviricetes sp.]
MKILKLNERKRKPSPNEKKFEKLLVDNGFEILGVREYADGNEYLISKDNVELDNVMLWDSNRLNVEKTFEMIVKTFEMKKQLQNYL